VGQKGYVSSRWPRQNLLLWVLIDRRFIKHNLEKGLVVTTHVPIGLQLVDIFTKLVPQDRFQDLVGKLGMIDIRLPT